MNVLQMKPMLGISIGLDPIGSGFIHDSFLCWWNNHYWTSSTR